MFNDCGRGVTGLEDVLEMEGGDAGGIGQGFELDLGLGDGAEGALGADDDAGKVKRVWVQEFVEVVAADAAHDLGVAGFDLCAVGLGEARRLPVDMAEQAGPRESVLQATW